VAKKCNAKHVCPDCQDKLARGELTPDAEDEGIGNDVYDDDDVDYTAMALGYIHNVLELAQRVHDYRSAAKRDGDVVFAKRLDDTEDNLTRMIEFMGKQLSPPEDEKETPVTTHAN